MSRWISMICGDDTAELIARHPNAFLLLAQIAMRAKWKDCRITHLKRGEALIGDWKASGLHSEMAYRVAKKTLEECGLATFQGTNKGTRATLANSAIFSLSPPANNGQENEQENSPTMDKERSGNGQGTTNKTERSETEREGKRLESATSPAFEELLRDHPKDTAAMFDRLIREINRITKQWSARPQFTQPELQILKSNAKYLDDLTDSDWKLLWLYMRADIPAEWGKFWQPPQRERFIEKIADVCNAADRWKRKCHLEGFRLDLENIATDAA